MLLKAPEIFLHFGVDAMSEEKDLISCGANSWKTRQCKEKNLISLVIILVNEKDLITL